MGCPNHPAVEATRICTGCETTWCGRCVRRVGLRESCLTCGHQLKKYFAPKTWPEVVGDAVTRVFSVEGIISAAAIAIANALGTYSWPLAWIFLSALVGYYFVIIRHVADGGEGLPGPSDSVLDWNETLGMAVRGIVCGFVGFLPVIAWRISGRSLDDLTVFGGLVLAGQLYMPAVVLAVTITNSTWGAFSPVAWIQLISRGGFNYLRFSVVWLISLAVGFTLLVLSSLLLPPTLIGAYGAGILWCLFWFVQAVLVGNFIRQNAEAFGWDVADIKAAVDEAAPPPPARAPEIPPAAAAIHLPLPTGDMRYQPTRSRGQSRMPSSIPLDLAPAAEESDEALAYAATSLELTAVGIEAVRADRSRHALAWTDVVGIVARCSPGGVTFVDLVSLPGKTLRFTPSTQITGVQIEGSPIERARTFIELVTARRRDVKVDAATREFVQGGIVLQIPDPTVMAEHDRRLA